MQLAKVITQPQPPRFGDQAPSHAGEQPSQRKRPKAATMRIISELSFRFPPSQQADIDARAALEALLASDLDHVPHQLLERAATEWARTKAFMPKASELIALAKSFVQPKPKDTRYNQAELNNMALDQRNADLEAQGKGKQARYDIIWRWDENSQRAFPDLRRPGDPGYRHDMNNVAL